MKTRFALGIAATLLLTPALVAAQPRNGGGRRNAPPPPSGTGAAPYCEAWKPAGWSFCLGSYNPINPLTDEYTTFLNTQAWKSYADPNATQTLGTFVFAGKVDVNLQRTGSINVLNLVGSSTGAFVLGLKSSTGASFYAFADGASTSFAFNTIGTSTNNGGIAQGLSHFAIWTLEGGGNCLTGNCSSVPEPSGDGLALVTFAALAGLALRRRRPPA